MLFTPKGKTLLAGLLCSLLLATGAGCAPSQGQSIWSLFQQEAASSTPREPAYVSPYDFNQLRVVDGHLAYVADDKVTSRFGIDVSDHQHEIDWYGVAASGVEFAFVRVGYRGFTSGGLFADEQFEANYAGAREAGITVGAYFFSQATTVAEAEEEAAFVLALLDGRPLDHAVAYDFEPVTDSAGRANALGAKQRTENARAFLARIEAAGYGTLLYGNNRDLNRYQSELKGEYPVWFAEYEVPVPTAQFDFVIWQYSSTGLVGGIDTPVDCNLWLTP